RKIQGSHSPSFWTPDLIVSNEMVPVKVYGLPMNGSVARVLACLEEVDAEYEVVVVDLHTGEHKRLPHLARNPFSQVPAFQDGDLILFESRAISKYILRKGSSHLLRESSLSESHDLMLSPRNSTVSCCQSSSKASLSRFTWEELVVLKLLKRIWRS
uniref:glutathione transferase n=1 Tax=Aegilops tauschii subsp. strangulata TaxID=200361 RepID=A0A452XJ97_AEGTS